MAREAKKSEGAAEAAKPLEQLMLDQMTGKYELVSVTSQWAMVLRKKEEYRHLTQQELLDAALSDVLTGRVSEDAVRTAYLEAVKAAAALAPDGREKPR